MSESALVLLWRQWWRRLGDWPARSFRVPERSEKPPDPQPGHLFAITDNVVYTSSRPVFLDCGCSFVRTAQK